MPPDNEPAAPQRRRFSIYFYNYITYAGIFLSLAIFTAELFLFGLDFFTGSTNVYLGILTYCFLPIFLIIGLILIPAGALWKRRRILKGLADWRPKKLLIDPAIPSHRNALFIFSIGTIILIVMSAVGAYKAFQYTESVHFCGIVCHKIMIPEYTTYLNSPHARVKCVECHIGEGATWYMKSKVSGARQVLRMLTNTYEKPIASPVHNLRPSEQTCEHCHWPGKFYGSSEIRKTYYARDVEEPRKWFLRMLMHVGRSENEDYGIHAHMYVDNEIYYAAEDDRRQKITWIKSVDKKGQETIFTTSKSKFKDQEPPPEAIRKMDCIDCHNRPTHRFEPPYKLVNAALLANEIDPEIPNIKSKLMDVLGAQYTSTQEAEEKIRQKLRDYYTQKQAEFYGSHQAKVEQAIEKAVEIFKNNFFPAMEARWDTHYNNIGHLWSNGCFRCHDGEHRSSDGEVISRDCNICHTIIEQGPVDALQTDTKGLPFVHPFEDDGAWQEMNCSDCHTGN